MVKVLQVIKEEQDLQQRQEHGVLKVQAQVHKVLKVAKDIEVHRVVQVLKVLKDIQLL